MTFEQRMAELGVDLSDLKPVAERRYDCAGHPVTVQAALMDYYADVIDRMETRLVNVTGERDWLKHMLCEICDMEANGPSCAHCNVKTGGVPEDWRPDDGYHD